MLRYVKNAYYPSIIKENFMISRYKSNYHFVSRRNTINSWMFFGQEQPNAKKEGKGPLRYQCKGFSGVMMIMGALCYVIDQEGIGRTVSVVLSKDKINHTSHDDAPKAMKKIRSAADWMISSKILKKSKP